MYCGLGTGFNKCLWLFALLFAIGAVLSGIIAGVSSSKCKDEYDALAPGDGAQVHAQHVDLEALIVLSLTKSQNLIPSPPGVCVENINR
jgi:hypothetical protein